MKFAFWILLNLIGFTLSHAQAANCEVSALALSLNEGGDAKCPLLKIEGKYKLKICEAAQSLLTGEDGSVRYLFKSAGSWMARQDLLDFDENVSTTEILLINNEGSKFSISKVKSQSNGHVLEQIACAGTMTR